MKTFYRISEIRDDITKLYEKGISRGYETSHKSFDEHYTFKLGSCTFIGSAPTSGKTETVLEIAMCMAELYGWKTAIFTPETGSRQEIAAELISKYFQKAFYKNYENHISEKELFEGQAWLDEHFYLIDPEDEDITIEGYLKLFNEIEVTFGITLQLTIGDPFNEFKHDFSKDEGRQDIYIERMLGLIRRNARKYNRHNIVVTHCRDQVLQQDKDSGIRYYPAPTARDFAGGQAWYRKGMGMMVNWRPPFGMNDANGMPYAINEAHIIIQKAKPKGIGKKGTVVWYFDVTKNRYYEKSNGRRIYAGGKDFEAPQERGLTPINKLVHRQEEVNFDKDDCPF